MQLQFGSRTELWKPMQVTFYVRQTGERVSLSNEKTMARNVLKPAVRHVQLFLRLKQIFKSGHFKDCCVSFSHQVTGTLGLLDVPADAFQDYLEDSAELEWRMMNKSKSLAITGSWSTSGKENNPDLKSKLFVPNLAFWNSVRQYCHCQGFAPSRLWCNIIHLKELPRHMSQITNDISNPVEQWTRRGLMFEVEQNALISGMWETTNDGKEECSNREGDISYTSAHWQWRKMGKWNSKL